MDGKWNGICSIFNPSQKRYLSRFIKEPKWYFVGNNAEKKSTCWMTEEGFRKYDHVFMKLIAECKEWRQIPPIRLIMAKDLPNIVMKGKIQVINLEPEDNTTN